MKQESYVVMALLQTQMPTSHALFLFRFCAPKDKTL